jgi:hypothetical protein
VIWSFQGFEVSWNQGISESRFMGSEVSKFQRFKLRGVSSNEGFRFSKYPRIP